MRHTRHLGFRFCLGALLAVCACESSLNASLEYRECSVHGECLPGWMCSIDNICVKRTGSLDDSQMLDDDASAGEPGSIPVGSPTARCDAGASCDGACVDTATDPANCGSCGMRCTSAEHGRATCKAGACELACEDGYGRCGDSCYSLTSDPAHCGDCAVSCPGAENAQSTCVSGACKLACDKGFELCGDRCVRLDADAKNCSACGKACADGQQCASGTCVSACPAGKLDCARSCVDPKTDVQHCGACGKVCTGATPICQNGSCSAQCAEGRMMCGANCIDMKTDIANCGACGKACPATKPRSHTACVAGSCGMACDDGFVACENECIGTALAAAASGTACTTLATLQDRMMCTNAGLNSEYCGGECVNPRNDVRHCGGCNRACSGRCSFGNCIGGL